MASGAGGRENLLRILAIRRTTGRVSRRVLLRLPEDRSKDEQTSNRQGPFTRSLHKLHFRSVMQIPILTQNGLEGKSRAQLHNARVADA